MISKECYVYISLPEQYEPVTAGKFVLETDDRGVNLGRFITENLISQGLKPLS